MESFDKMISKILALFHSRKHESKETLDKIYLQNDKFLPVVCELLNAGQTVTLKARGYSMRPFIEHDRDDLIFAKADRVEERDVILAEIYKGHYVCHRVEKIEGNSITLRGDGNIRGTENCTLDDVRGRLIQVIRLGKTWNLDDSRFWKIYSAVWPKLLPIRKYLLAINKLFILRQMPDRWKQKNNRR